VVLDATFRRALARHGGDAVLGPLRVACPISEHRSIVGGCGVYVVCDDLDRVLYVGSVHRPGNPRGISDRIARHLADPLKALRWARLWVLVVAEGRSLEWVRTYEAIVGTELQPSWNERLPRLLETVQ
jgi:hypothetical protein